MDWTHVVSAYKGPLNKAVYPWKTNFTIKFSQKLWSWLECMYLVYIVILCLFGFFFLVLFRNSKWQPQQDTVLSQESVGKWTKHFFLEPTTNLIKSKLYMSNYWMVFTKFSFLCQSDIQDGHHCRTNLT